MQGPLTGPAKQGAHANTTYTHRHHPAGLSSEASGVRKARQHGQEGKGAEVAGGGAQVVYASRARVRGAVLVAQEDCDERQVRPEGVLQHVHREALQAATQRVERRAALVALNLGATALLAHRAHEAPPVTCDALDALNRLHRVRVDHPKLRYPLHSAKLVESTPVESAPGDPHMAHNAPQPPPRPGLLWPGALAQLHTHASAQNHLRLDLRYAYG